MNNRSCDRVELPALHRRRMTERVKKYGSIFIRLKNQFLIIKRDISRESTSHLSPIAPKILAKLHYAYVIRIPHLSAQINLINAHGTLFLAHFSAYYCDYNFTYIFKTVFKLIVFNWNRCKFFTWTL